MPEDRVGSLKRQRAEALERVGSYLLSEKGADRLSESDLDRFEKACFTDGWRIPKGWCEEVDRELLVLVDQEFPYAPPRFAVEPPPEPLAWPHIESSGLLCLLPGDASIDTVDPIAVLKDLFEDARYLCLESERGNNTEEFSTEFLSYWRVAASKVGAATRVLSLLEPCGPSRRITVLEEAKRVFVAECDLGLEAWFGRRYGRSRDLTKEQTQDGLLLWLPNPLVPQEYPATGIDLIKIARELGPEDLKLLEEMAASSPPKLRVIVGMASNGVACFGSVECPKPPVQRTQRGKRVQGSEGFRPGRVPSHVAAQRYLRPPVVLANVDRADHMWVHGRDRDLSQAQLRDKRVACLGCGSVGGTVARLVAQAGVGNLLLVDPQRLEWSNIGRHVLGARSVNKYKAEELAKEIRSAFPHLHSVGFKVERVGPHAGDLMATLKSYDLIVSMMGNWNVETFLNDWQREDANSPAILYAWTEPRAAATHTVLISPGQGCLRCGFDRLGHLKLQATSWLDDSIYYQEPSCGASFTPYGPAELCWAHALISTTAIEALFGSATSPFHKAWVCATDHLKEAGGAWAERWLSEVGDPGNGGKTIIVPWRKSGVCPTCR